MAITDQLENLQKNKNMIPPNSAVVATADLQEPVDIPPVDQT